VEQSQIYTIKTIAIASIIISHLHYFIDFQHDTATTLAAKLGLGLFFFASGIGLTFSRLDGFYTRRALRLLPLYLLALAVIFCNLLPSEKIWGLTGGYWFVNTIIIYYLIYPIISKSLRNATIVFFIGVLAYGGLKLVAPYVLGFFSINFFYYYWPFAVGIFLNRMILRDIIMLCIGAVALLLIGRSFAHGEASNALYSMSISLVLIPISIFAYRNLRFESSAVKLIAKDTYAIYLFHLMIFYVVAQLGNPYLTVIGGLIATLTISHFIQKLDGAIRRAIISIVTSL
jgi:peptidoglycan/LPS O-acetylase OafA/YrhL